MPPSWSVNLRMLAFRGKRRQVAVILLFVVNFILTLFTITNEMDGSRTGRDRQSKLVALANSPGADIFLLQDVALHKPESINVGYSLAKRIQAKCIQSTKPPYSAQRVNVYLPYKSSDNKTQLCAIWKTGSTFFKRVFKIENKVGSGQMTFDPYDLPFSTSYIQKSRLISNSASSRRFMFVRDPYSRLYAAYVDKLFAPNPVFWKKIGISAIHAVRKHARKKSLRCGHDLKFSEYIKYVVLTLTNTTDAPKDGHSLPMTSWCRPCDIRYDYVGKMESFGPDSLELIKYMNLTHTEKLLREQGEELAAIDAIRDTLDQAFDRTFRAHYNDCITVKVALHRCWRKLQYRGLIGDEDLNISNEEIEQLTLPQAINIARKARSKSTKEDRKQLKWKYFKRMFSEVNAFDMEMLKHIYKDDFNLFEYDHTPVELFGATEQL